MSPAESMIESKSAIPGASAEQAGEPRAQGQSGPPAEIAENYQYWRENGGTWADEYSRRKTWMVLYHIQEIMLTEYVLRHAEGRKTPLRVLEFGCGVGRHLQNLSRLANVEVHGFDQSASMIEGCRRWADSDFLRDRVTVGQPVGPLPYANGSFDLVYSAEVLVHVRPEDITGTLTELVRIARGHVLHIEPSPDFTVDGTVHSGCWNHDLPSLYRAMGRTCESLGRGYSAHAAWRTVVGGTPKFRWKPELLELYQKMEIDIDRGFSVTDNAKRDAESKSQIWLDRSTVLESDLRLSLDSLRMSSAGLETTGESLRIAQATIAQCVAAEAALRAGHASAESAHAARMESLAAAAAAERDSLTTELAAARAALEAAERHASERILAAEEAAATGIRTAKAESERERSELAEAAAGLAARIRALEHEQLAARSARERERTAEALDSQTRARAWSLAMDRLRADAEAAKVELVWAKERHAAFVDGVRAHVRRP